MTEDHDDQPVRAGQVATSWLLITVLALVVVVGLVLLAMRGAG